MISLCTVIEDRIRNDYHVIFMESIQKQCRSISEIVICDLNAIPKSCVYKKNVIVGPSIHHNVLNHNIPRDVSTWHALAIHATIDRASKEYLLITDSDIFLYKEGIDLWLIEMMEKYNLNYIGCAKNNPTTQSFKYFPCVQFCMVRKKDLPPPSWSSDKFSPKQSCLYCKLFSDKFLVPHHCIKQEELAKYPNPSGFADTGYLLWLWALENKWRWLSFLPDGLHVYNTKYLRSNCEIENIKIKNEKLLYHQTGAFHFYPQGLKEFTEEYECSKGAS